jgi:hypothetical protein
MTRKVTTDRAYVDPLAGKPEQRRGTILELPKHDASSLLPTIKHEGAVAAAHRTVSRVLQNGDAMFFLSAPSVKKRAPEAGGLPVA